MDKEKKLKFILGVLIIIAVLVWARGCKKPDTGTVLEQLNPGEVSSLLAMSSSTESFARSSYSEWGRNPFVLETGKSTKKFVLNGILWDDQNPKALIGDQIVGKGEYIGPAIVEDIRLDRVILNNGMEYWELKLGEE